MAACECTHTMQTHYQMHINTYKDAQPRIALTHTCPTLTVSVEEPKSNVFTVRSILPEKHRFWSAPIYPDVFDSVDACINWWRHHSCAAEISQPARITDSSIVMIIRHNTVQKHLVRYVIALLRGRAVILSRLRPPSVLSLSPPPRLSLCLSLSLSLSLALSLVLALPLSLCLPRSIVRSLWRGRTLSPLLTHKQTHACARNNTPARVEYSGLVRVGGAARIDKHIVHAHFGIP